MTRVQQPKNGDFFSKWHYALWKACKFGYEMHGAPTDRKTMGAFQRQCHRGFDHAQKLLLDLVAENRSDCSITRQEQKYRESLIRKIADSIAFTICGTSPSVLQPWCTQSAPVHIDLDELAFTIECASKLNSESRDQFCLIADLTSCIHTCDLLKVDYRNGAKQRIFPVEVKTGSKNAELYKSLNDGIKKGVCQHYFAAKHTPKELKQMGRMLSQITTNYKSTRTFMRNFRKLPTEISWYPTYSRRTFAAGLSQAIESAKKFGTAGILVDGCLLIGLGFSREPTEAQSRANLVYDSLEKSLAEGSDVRRFDPLKDNLGAMVCVPFCLWDVTLDERLLIAKREVVIRCGLIGNRFLRVLNEGGNSFEFATRKETALYKQRNPGKAPWEWDFRAIKLGDNIVSGGLIQPVSTDLVHPAALTETIRAKLNQSDVYDLDCRNPGAHIIVNFEYL